MTQSFTARSYCTGYTGLEMAVRAVIGDFDVLSHSDIKPAANALLAYHYPDIPNLGDMRAIDYAGLDRADVMIGSWPCQPHSAAGKRLGEADPRDLWPEYLRAIDATRPAIFFGENVARITSNGELRRVVTSLAERGYVGAWRSVRASDVGACHRRDRMFIVAIDPAANTAGIGRIEGWTEHARVQRRQDAALGSSGVHLSLLPTPSASNYGTNQGGAAGRVGVVRESLDTMARKGRFLRWGKYTDAIARHEQALGRLVPEPTQPSVRTGKPQLSARFVEWMMMLPDGWVTDVPGLVDSPRKSVRNAQLSLLGDGVVPAQGAAAFRFLMTHLTTRFTGEMAA